MTKLFYNLGGGGKIILIPFDPHNEEISELIRPRKKRGGTNILINPSYIVQRNLKHRKKSVIKTKATDGLHISIFSENGQTEGELAHHCHSAWCHGRSA